MTKINEALNSVVKYFRPKTAHSDDFSLSAIHYKLVFGILLVCCILSGLTSWYAPIECTKTDSKNYDASLVKQWCYANSTFVVKDTNYTGVFNSLSESTNQVVYLRYYQWVTLALFAQAACFQIPRILWKSFEAGRVKRMADYVKNLELVASEDRIAKVTLLVDYFLQPCRRHQNRNYFTYFACCQTFYFFNIIAQILFTNAFLDYQFLSLVPQWLMNVPVLNRVFPKLAKCHFRGYGPGGDLQRDDILCVLAMNVLIEKIYLMLWFLLAIALLAATIQFSFLIAMYVSTKLRRNLSKDKEFLDRLSCGPSDCLLLKFFRESVDSVVYMEFKLIALKRLSPPDDGEKL